VSTSAIGTILDAIVAGIDALGALDGVNIFSGPVLRMEEAGEEAVFLGDCRLTEVEMAMGSETWTIQGEVITAGKTWQGTTEQTIKASRDRTLAIFAALETYLNDTYTSPLPDVTVTSAELIPFLSPEIGRGTSLQFELTVKASKNP